MKRYKNVLITIIVTAISFVLNYAINFFLTPYITTNVGTEAYGYVSLAKSFASYTNIITVALNGYASRFIAVEYHKKNYKKANEYYTSVFLADLFLGLLFLIAMIVFSANINSFFEIDTTILFDIQMLFVLIFLNMGLNLSATAFQSSAYIADKLNIVAVFKCLSYFVEAFVLLSCYTLFSSRVSYVGVATIAASLVIIICNFVIGKKYTPELKVKLSFFSLRAVKDLVGNGIWNTVSSLGSLLNTGLDLIVANLLLSPYAMGQISIVKSISVIFSSLFQMCSTPFQPIFLEEYSHHKKSELLNSIKASMKLSGMIASVAFAGFVTLGRCYFQLWVPEQDTELLFTITILATLSGVAEGLVFPLYYVYTLTIKNKIPSILSLLSGILNVLGMYLLIVYGNIGIIAVQLTTCVLMLFQSLVTNPIYAANCLNVKWYYFYPTILRHFLGTVIIVVLLLIYSNFYAAVSWISFAKNVIIEGGVGCFIYFVVVFSSKEKKATLNLILSKFK